MKNDIDNYYENMIDISDAMKPNNKFIQFKKIQNEDGTTIQFPNDLMQFKSDNFVKEKLTFNDKKRALKRMISNLEINIKKEVELELVSIKSKLEEQIKNKYNYDFLLKKLNDILELY